MAIEVNELTLLLKAFQFAAVKHNGQTRKGADKLPYIVHPIAVARILSSEAAITDNELICSALLHDTVEDTHATAEEIEDNFGSEIREIVMDVTDDKALPKEERKLKQVEHAAHACDKAKLVKLADKISNLRDIQSTPPEGWSTERKQEYFDWAKKVIDRVRGVNPTLEGIFDAEYLKRPASEG